MSTQHTNNIETQQFADIVTVTNAHGLHTLSSSSIPRGACLLDVDDMKQLVNMSQPTYASFNTNSQGAFYFIKAAPESYRHAKYARVVLDPQQWQRFYSTPSEAVSIELLDTRDAKQLVYMSEPISALFYADSQDIFCIIRVTPGSYRHVRWAYMLPDRPQPSTAGNPHDPSTTTFQIISPHIE